MKYCSECGSETEKRIPEGDNRERDCCKGCDLIHYTNPKIIVGTIPVKDESILLCKRAIEPRYGKWTLPGGFLENGETVSQGAFRETLEETNTEVEMGELYAIFNVPQFFNEANIPWEELAFPFVPIALKNVFADMKKNEFPLTTHTIERRK